MPLLPLKLPPGVFRNGTAYSSSGRFYDSSLVRFFEGTIRPVGGWKKVDSTQTALSGISRAIHTWRSSQSKFVAVGTHTNLYCSQDGGTLDDITPAGYVSGRADSLPGLGYGYGSYGGGNFNESQYSTTPLEATVWSLDNWGNYLIACANTDGKIYKWTGTGVATVISAAPTGNRMVLVTPERHLVALGAGGNSRLVQWCSQENYDDWTPVATNTAGDIELQTQGSITTARKVRGQTLILTDMDAHVMTYQGLPYVYGVERVGSGCGCAGINAIAVVDSGAVWMGFGSFYSFNGNVSPLPSDVSDYVFSDINLSQSAKIFAGVNSAFREITWFYPSAASTENDRYVTYNYAEGHWSIGSMARTCWSDFGVYPHPLAVSPNGYLYEHESGWTNDGTSLGAARFLESGPVEISGGNQIIHATQVIPDERSAGQVQLRFYTKATPESSSASYGPYQMSPYTNVRFSGRQFAMRIEGTSDTDWRVGIIRLDGKPGGQR